MPLPAGTGLSRRSFLARAGGLGAHRLRGRPARLRAPSSEGIARAAGAKEQGPRLDLLRRRHRLALGAGAGRRSRATGQLRPSPARSSRDQGTPWTEDARLHWNPVAGAVRQAAPGGQGQRSCPAIGYSSPDQSHFTSRHYWEVGELRHRRRARAGSAACSTGSARADNPLQGLSLDGSLVALAGHRPGPGRRDLGAELRPLGAGRLGRRRGAHVRAPCQRLGRAGRQRPATRACRPPAAPCAGEAAATRSCSRSRSEIASPVPYPTDGDATSPRAWPGWRRCSTPGLPIRCAALSAPGAFDTHDNQEDEFKRGLQRDLRRGPRLPARPRGPRASPTAS